MRIWVDITDASHVVFFAPIVRRHEDAGHTLTITARTAPRDPALFVDRLLELARRRSRRARLARLARDAGDAGSTPLV